MLVFLSVSAKGHVADADSRIPQGYAGVMRLQA
jgi:hypothetical protein